MCPTDFLIHLCQDIQSKMLPRGHHIRLQFLGTISGNLINLTYGLTIGWIIVYTNQFHSSANPLKVPPLDPIEVKWIELSLYIGGLIGTIFLTMNGDVFGRKYTLVVLIVPQGFAWLSKMLATNATEVYIGRFLSGFSAGGSINLIVLFVTELADDKFRGRLSSILPLSITIGMLIIFISNIYTSFMNIAYIALTVLFLYLCLYTFFPDTPRQLYKIRRKEQAINSLQIYKDISDLECQTDDCYQIEVKKMRRALIAESGCILQNSGKATLKSLIISVALIILNVYVNWFVMHHLTKHQLLDRALLSISDFRIVIGVCQVAGSLLCLTIVDFVERKYILLASLVGITVSQVIYAIYDAYFTDKTSLPILFIAIAAFSLHFGVYPLTFVLIPEIIPERIRIYAVTFVFSLMWMLMFALSYSETALADYLYSANYVIVPIFIAINIVCSLIFWILIPPTKKKSYGQIFSHLNFGLDL
ncbi:uncharacterized protein LOC129567369 [Sitodiplosis mosellana]|uniref:uncharacterized protein LOC129567369 n=1 Tax=Sitodiplosis mosellana TaxID=263140 RepID=UPI002443DBFA|nr:uncharacterized protein LOC129567369 [Sitodiplosis mosellana]